MNRSILTQNLELVNCYFIKAIQSYEGVVVDDNGKETSVIEIRAALTEKDEVTLGLYLSDTEAAAVMEELAVWHKERNDYRLLYRMPQIGQGADRRSNREQNTQIQRLKQKQD